MSTFNISFVVFITIYLQIVYAHPTIQDIIRYNETQARLPGSFAVNDDETEVQTLFLRDMYEEDREHETTHHVNTTTEPPTTHNVDTLSIMWYLISFGGLITFFLLVSFSEVCCKLPRTNVQTLNMEEVTSPPSYDQFAPPSYESLFEEKNPKKKPQKRKKLNVFVVSVHDKSRRELQRVNPVEFGEVISRNSMGDGEVVTPPPPP